MTVVPCSRAAAVSSSITSSPDIESSDPVGSSANSTSGPATRPRASATRWACPPDSSPDLRYSSPSRPSVPNHFLAAVIAGPRRGAGQQQGQRDVLFGGQLGDQLTGLEHEPEPVPAQRAAPVIAQRVQPLPAEPDLPLLGNQDARQAVQQGGLARAARPHDRDDLALPDAQRGAAQRRRLAERLHQVSRLDNLRSS